VVPLLKQRKRTASHNWTETCFYHLKSVDCGRSGLWKSFGCQWKNE